MTSAVSSTTYRVDLAQRSAYARCYSMLVAMGATRKQAAQQAYHASWDIAQEGYLIWLAYKEKHNDKPLEYNAKVCVSIAYKRYWKEDKRHRIRPPKRRKQQTQEAQEAQEAQEHTEASLRQLGVRAKDLKQEYWQASTLLADIAELDLPLAYKRLAKLLASSLRKKECAALLNVAPSRITAMRDRLRAAMLDNELVYMVDTALLPSAPGAPWYSATYRAEYEYAQHEPAKRTASLPSAQACQLSRRAWRIAYRKQRLASKLADMCQARYGKQQLPEENDKPSIAYDAHPKWETRSVDLAWWQLLTAKCGATYKPA